jgi:uncharacterized membrane protein YccC
VRQLKQTAQDLWDRFSASDPGLIRLLSGLTTVGAILVTLAVLAPLHASSRLLVAGALGAMVATFAVTDARPRDQAVTLALGLLVAFASVSIGALLFTRRIASDAVFILLIFTAVYIRRFGARGTGLGMIGFQIYFISQFTRADPAKLPPMLGTLLLGFGASALVRFGLVRATPERTLVRLVQAFRARLGAVIDTLTTLTTAQPGSHAAESDRDAVTRSTTRLHQCALMIQARLEVSTTDAYTASVLERRIADAEIAAEHLGRVLVRAMVEDGARLRTRQDRRDERRLADDLGVLHMLLQAPLGPRSAHFLSSRDRLLAYRDDSAIPDTDPALQEAYRTIGEMAHALLGIRVALGVEAGPEDLDGPQTARSREELDTEDLSVRTAAEEDRPDSPPPPTGLDRLTTRLAFQVSAGSALATVGGELLSPQRWYWAVLTCWVVFLNTSSTGDILVKGYRRLAGTVIGVLAGAGLAVWLGGDPTLAFALVIVCVFGMFFTAPLSYTLVSFFVTTLVGLLYTLLGEFSEGVLLLRIEETAVGASCGFLTALVVLPVQISTHTDQRLAEALDRLRATLSLTIPQLAGGPRVDLLHSARELDTALDTLHKSAEPITHPASPLRSRRRRARYIMGLLDGCAYHARSLAAIAEMIPGNPNIGAEPRLTAIGRRLDGNVAVLADFVRTGRGDQAGRLETEPSIPALLHGSGHRRSDLLDEEPMGTEPHLDPAVATVLPGAPSGLVTVRVLRHLQRLDETIIALARPLGLTDTAKRGRGTDEDDQDGPAGPDRGHRQAA